MRNSVFARIAFAIFLAAPLVTMAGQQQPSNPSSPPQAGSEMQGLASPSNTQVMGTLSKVDSTANTLTIKKADNQEQSFSLDAAAKITVDGKAASISELKPGHKVSVTTDGKKATAVSATSASSSS